MPFRWLGNRLRQSPAGRCDPARPTAASEPAEAMDSPAASWYLASYALVQTSAAHARWNSSALNSRPCARQWPTRNRSVSSTVASSSALTVEYCAGAKPTWTASLSTIRLSQSCTNRSASPAQVAGKPVAVADHDFGLAGSQPVTGTASGIVDPLRAGHLVEVDVRILLRTQPQPVAAVVPGRRWCRVETSAGWGASRISRANASAKATAAWSAAGHVGIRGCDVGAGERSGHGYSAGNMRRWTSTHAAIHGESGRTLTTTSRSSASRSPMTADRCPGLNISSAGGLPRCSMHHWAQGGQDRRHAREMTSEHPHMRRWRRVSSAAPPASCQLAHPCRRLSARPSTLPGPWSQDSSRQDGPHDLTDALGSSSWRPPPKPQATRAPRWPALTTRLAGPTRLPTRTNYHREHRRPLLNGGPLLQRALNGAWSAGAGSLVAGG